MTNEEKQQIEQSAQDNIDLNYESWSFEQRRANRKFSHSEWLDVRDAVLRRQQSDNVEARRKRLATLEAARNGKRAEVTAEIDRELEPTKQRLKRDWLANNPTFTESDFESKAWHLLKANLLEQRGADAANAEIKRQLSTGRY